MIGSGDDRKGREGGGFFLIVFVFFEKWRKCFVFGMILRVEGVGVGCF